VHGRANQIWRLIANDDGTYRLLNEHSGLAVSSSAENSNVYQWQWDARDHQKWRIRRISR
jgi:hypothetical protein